MLKGLSKQDRQGVRKPSDVERKYNLGEVVQTVRVIQESNVPDDVLNNYYTKGETDYKILQLKELLESQLSNGDYRVVDDVIEWINPPMALDTEYRLTERWLGKPVYTKAVMQDVSQRGNTEGTELIEISVATPDFEKCIKYSGHTTGIGNCLIPFMYEGAFIGVYTMNESTIFVDVQNKLFLDSTQLYIQVWYTKTE